MAALGLVLGLLGMHIMAGGAMAPGTGMASGHGMSMAASAHSASSSPEGMMAGGVVSFPVDAVVSADGMGGSGHVMATMAPGMQDGTAMSCPVTGHGDAMAVHGGCTPTAGSPVVALPNPSALVGLAPEAFFPAIPGHGSLDRPAGGPSLVQLQVNRT